MADDDAKISVTADQQLARTDRTQFHKLRIALSVAAAVICLLLVSLWVRSRWDCDVLVWNGWRKITVFSGYGQIRVIEWNTTSTDEPLLRWHRGSFMPDGIGPWYFQSNQQQIFLVFPHRLPIIIFIMLATLPWVKLHYNLREMLIATAFVALVLMLFG